MLAGNFVDDALCSFLDSAIFWPGHMAPKYWNMVVSHLYSFFYKVCQCFSSTLFVGDTNRPGSVRTLYLIVVGMLKAWPRQRVMRWIKPLEKPLSWFVMMVYSSVLLVSDVQIDFALDRSVRITDALWHVEWMSNWKLRVANCLSCDGPLCRITWPQAQYSRLASLHWWETKSGKRLDLSRWPCISCLVIYVITIAYCYYQIDLCH